MNMNEKRLYKIYILKYKDEVIYVGQTKQKYLSYRKRNGYTNIPKDIVKESSIELIEETTDASHERFWINYYRDLGCNLYNKHDGVFGDRKEYIKFYTEENKEKIKERMNNYRKENKELLKERREKWIEKNPDYMKNYMKEWEDRNKEDRKKYRRELRKNNIELYREKERFRKQNKKNK